MGVGSIEFHNTQAILKLYDLGLSARGTASRSNVFGPARPLEPLSRQSDNPNQAHLLWSLTPNPHIAAICHTQSQCHTSPDPREKTSVEGGH